ncbi:polysaccharide biosynthesis/export family protein [uncultured Sphingomonas sp.]|uniref:polysaccharide biosynthesis/export family protein n=1 Tax=uncultured Sphingomonas sp. TaxID=158754 RepID=UPI0025D26888|nr:polysaccharide biosynthesis/export family protein [uncultured Sphingomonas sp.]
MKLIPAAMLAIALHGVAATAQTAPVKNTQVTTYRINPGDQIDIYVWGDERLQRSLNVLPDGTFSFPLAGTVRAAGRTTTEVEGDLAQLLAPQYKGVPQQVTVSVKIPSGMQFSVIGKVRAPGTFSPTRYVNLLGALTLAGGPTEFADLSNIIILRRDGSRTNIIRSRVGDILRGKPGNSDLSDTGLPQLMAGDTVVVP